MKTTLTWNTRTTPAPLRSMLTTLGDRYPIRRDGSRGIEVTFTPVAEPGLCEIERQGNAATVRYGSSAQAGRAVGALLSGLVADGKVSRQSTPFTMLGIMLDCSRNAVMTVDHVKRWLGQLALLGYNTVMLYTEETYELPDEPYFGYQRGAYTKAELKAIDAYASKLNIEVIPCIQTLGHLEKMLRHGAYNAVRDTSTVLLVGDEKTYALIDKMVRHWKGVCRSPRIHIGMDETHDLGRGRYLDLNGYRDAYELFNEHLAQVVNICKQHDLQPMIWSDMYFRLGSRTGSYYDPACVIPRKVINKIPAAAELVYWDYYHDNKAFYLEWIARHRAMGKEPVMASGIWTWNKYWHDQRTTERLALPCIEACREADVRELFFTMWGDNGAYCDHDSAFAGMTLCADKAYGSAGDATALEKRFATVCGGSYAAHVLASEIHGCTAGFQPNMWDDPIFETHVRNNAKDKPAAIARTASNYAKLAAKLKAHRRDRATGDLDHAWQLANTFALRYGLTSRLLAAYRKKDRRALARLSKEIPQAISAVKALEQSFRRMWLGHNKPEGLETIQAQFGMLELRYRELSRRLTEYVSGNIFTIAEWEHPCPPNK